MCVSSVYETCQTPGKQQIPQDKTVRNDNLLESFSNLESFNNLAGLICGENTSQQCCGVSSRESFPFAKSAQGQDDKFDF